MMNNYGTPPVALASGDGAVVTDVDGKSYLDLLGGIAVNVLGHRHPPSSRPSREQMSTLGHTSNLYATEPGVALAEALVALLGADAEPGCSSATPAPRPTRWRSSSPVSPAARNLLPRKEAFHGRTMGSLALTGQPAKQAPFEPLPGDVTHVPYGDTDALAAAVGDDTAAVFLEPIMGESGVVVPPDGYLAAARDITARHGALLVLDEVQTGMGRTGTFFAHQHDGITPDVVTLAKGLGGGLPIGACLAIGPAARPADARPARQHLRRQPGLRGGRAGGAAGAGRRRPGPARRGARKDVAPGHRIARPPADRPRPRPRPAVRRGADRARAPRRPRRPPATPDSWSTPPHPT